MKALTVQQPWAWAIVHGGKTVENRTQAWTYRGPLAIHAGLREDTAAYDDDMIRHALGQLDSSWELQQQLETGVILGVVDLVDVHRADGLESDPWEWCCRPWGQGPGVHLKPDGTFTGPTTHLVLEHARPLPDPIPCRGVLGLWTPPADVLGQITDQLTNTKENAR